MSCPYLHRRNLEPASVGEVQETMGNLAFVMTTSSILLALTVVTGIVDAVSFLAMGRVFTANMTGNIVLLGLAFAGVRGLSISRSSVALISFLTGAVAGGRLASDVSGLNHWVSRGFWVEALLLAFGATSAIGLGSDATNNPLHLYALIASTAMAMGLRNAVVRKLGVPDLTTTVLTLTITGLAADSRIAGGDNSRWQRRVAAIVAMLAGAAAGARMVIRSISVPLAICSVIMAACAIAHMQINSKRRQP
jgi:uncharacterized membrane protein YoaK (UPF0700 family)